MNKLIIINDDNCKAELAAFLKAHPKSVKLVVDTDEVDLKIDRLLENMNTIYRTQKKIAINTAESLIVVNVNDIVRCESKRNYTELHFHDKKTILVSRTLKDFDELLEPYQFWRIHKSHLINLNYLDKFVKSEGGHVLLKDGSKITVSTRKKEKLMRLLEKL